MNNDKNKETARPGIAGSKDRTIAMEKYTEKIIEYVNKKRVDKVKEMLAEIPEGAKGVRCTYLLNRVLIMKNSDGYKEKIMKLLIDHGARPDGNIFFWAIKKCRPDLLKKVLDGGINPNRKNSQGIFPLLMVVMSSRISPEVKLLRTIFGHKKPDIPQNSYYAPAEVIKLLLEYGADPTVTHPGGMPFIIALGDLEQFSPELFKLAVKKGANLNRKFKGETCLDRIIGHRKRLSAFALIKLGAKKTDNFKEKLKELRDLDTVKEEEVEKPGLWLPETPAEQIKEERKKFLKFAQYLQRGTFYNRIFTLLKSLTNIHSKINYQDRVSFGAEIHVPADKAEYGLELARAGNWWAEKKKLQDLGESGLGIESDDYYVVRTVPGTALSFPYKLYLLYQAGILRVMPGEQTGPPVQWTFCTPQAIYDLIIKIYLLGMSCSAEPLTSVEIFKNILNSDSDFGAVWAYRGMTLDIGNGGKIDSGKKQLNLFYGFPLREIPTFEGPVESALSLSMLSRLNAIICWAAMDSSFAASVEREIEEKYKINFTNNYGNGLVGRKVISEFGKWIKDYGVNHFEDINRAIQRDIGKFSVEAMRNILRYKIREITFEDVKGQISPEIAGAVFLLSELKFVTVGEGNSVIITGKPDKIEEVFGSWILMANSHADRVIVRIIQYYTGTLPGKYRNKTLQEVIAGCK